MFKKKCPRCGKKVGKGDNFCPYCGENLRKNDKEDYGFLGKSDSEDFIPEMSLGPFDSMLNKMMNSAMKILAKQMKEIQREMPPVDKKSSMNPNSNVRIQFYINGKKVDIPNPMMPVPREQVFEKKEIKLPRISKEKADKFAKLPKKEAKSKMRRLSEKLVYEISVPGVEAIEDVLINQLENSIEIKALAKDKVYKKTIQVNLPILGYGLKNGNLILELQAK